MKLMILLFLVILPFQLVFGGILSSIPSMNLSRMVKDWAMQKCRDDKGEQECKQEIIDLMTELSERLGDVVMFSYVE
jgi:hypothetical protein